MHTKLLPKIKKNLDKLKKYNTRDYNSEEVKLKKYSDSLDLKANPDKREKMYAERQAKLKSRFGKIIKVGRKRFRL